MSDTTALRQARRRHALTVGLLAHLALAAVFGLEWTGLVSKLERLVYDSYLGYLTPPAEANPGVVLIDYTEADEARYQYPLPDRYLAELLERLTAAGALAIGLDLIRDRPEPSAGDPADYQRLVDAFNADDSIIAIVKDTPPPIKPPPALADQPARLGFADVVQDPDGIVRRGLLYLTTSAGTRPSLALQLAGRRLWADGVKTDWQDGSLHLGASEVARLRPQASSLYAGAGMKVDEGGYQFLLSFPACAQGYRRMRVSEVLDSDGKDLDLEGRLVLIGNTSKIYKDEFEVPVDCHGASGEMFGTDLHAEIISQLVEQARGVARPLETLQQRLTNPALGWSAGVAWVWLWGMVGGVTAALIASPVVLAVAVVGEAVTIFGTGFATFVGTGLWLPVVAPFAAAAGAAALVVVYLMTRARGEREQLTRLFSAVVSEGVANSIWRTRALVLGARRPPPKLMSSTVLFSDIKGFSTISNQLPETRLAAWLDLYMEPMVDSVVGHGGFIEKFAGDGLTVAFGVPEPRETDAEVAADARSAVDCALDMAGRLDALNRAMAERDLPQVKIRVGIHSGPLMVGVIGGAKRWQFSIIGDVANTAARLEAYDKEGAGLGSEADHCRILISEATYSLLEGRYAVDAAGMLEMRNRGPINVYRIIGVRALDRAQSGGP